MKVDPELAKKMIRVHGYKRVVAYNVERSAMLSKFEGEPDGCAAHVDEVVAMVSGTIRLECSTPRKERKPNGEVVEHRGRIADIPMVVLLEGAWGKASGSGVASDRLDRIEAALLQLTEGDDEPEPAAAMSDTLARAVDTLLPLLVAKFGAKGAAPIQGPAAVAPSSSRPPGSLTKEDAAQLSRAIANFKAQDPAAFEQYRAILVAKYGTDANPQP